MNNKFNIDNILNSYFDDSAVAIQSVKENLETIKEIALAIYECQKKGNKLLIGGNGGSCADAEHFAGEMTCTYSDPDRSGFSAISLTNNPSAITAWSNDFGYETYFKRQVRAHGKAGDILFLISTGGGDREKGYSMNLVSAADEAKNIGMKLFSLVGKTGGELEKVSHNSIKVSSFKTSHIQEAHIAIIHSICEILDSVDKN